MWVEQLSSNKLEKLAEGASSGFRLPEHGHRRVDKLQLSGLGGGVGRAGLLTGGGESAWSVGCAGS